MNMKQIIICFVLIFAGGCDRKASAMTFSGGESVTVRVSLNGIEFRIEGGKFLFKDQSFEVPKPSCAIDVKAMDNRLVVRIDGKQVYRGK